MEPRSLAEATITGGRHVPESPVTARPSRVLVTAGHVDHGKSTLVEWLTGTHPDRLEEERRRGLTIDLGFASTALGEVEVGIVDVPGHVRFLKNMLAGVGAVDASLFVVAATEGWKPQSEDHLRILDVVGVRHGLIALTRAALVDPSRLAAVQAQVTARVAGTFLEGAPVVPVDVPAGIGTEGEGGLRSALEAMIARVPPAPDLGRPRLWIDRSFAIRGSGTVVTGTLAGGSVRVGDHLSIVAGGRHHVAVRVRGLESYGRSLEVADPGRRLAVNLSGADRHAASRGAALVQPDRWHACAVLDASLALFPGVGHAVSHRGSYLLHVGSGEQAVRLRVLGRRATVEPESTGAVRLWLDHPLPLVPGDRYVLREAGRRELLGGGEVLDVAPVLPVRSARPSRSVERVVAERGWVEPAELERLTGVAVAPTLGQWVVSPEALEKARTEVAERVRQAGPTGLDVSVLGARDRLVAGTIPGVTVSHGVVGFGDTVSGDRHDLEGHPYLLALRRDPFSPAQGMSVDRNDLRRLVRSGLVVDTGDLHFAASALDEAARRIAELLERSPEGVRVSDVRDALGTSRKYVLAILSHFDSTGVTRRLGDLRVGGPRRPAPQQRQASTP